MPVAVVTGSTGYVGAELTKQLLQKGFDVRGTVRSSSSKRSVELQNALVKIGPGQLQLAEADLLKPGSFDTVLEGADYLFHVASPFVIHVADQQRDLIEPAVNGTRNVMLAAAKHKATLKRVVLTSSVAAVHDCHQRQVPKSGPEGKYSEEDFNETSTLEGEPPEGYWVSKVAAEKEAWGLAQQHGLDLVTILPNFILGPALTASAAETSTSAGHMKAFLEAPDGKVPSGTWTITDVRDVAAAHILAATNPSASGRYIVSLADSISARDHTTALKARFPGLSIPDGDEAPVKSRVDNSKVQRELGLQLTAAAESVADLAESLIRLGVVQVPGVSV